MVDNIKRFIHCVTPADTCNLKCSYCGLREEDGMELSGGEVKENKHKYSAETIRKALSLKRLGGVCYVDVVGIGETLIDHEVIEIVRELLLEGHFVDITTNGTLTKRFEELLAAVDPAYYGHLKFTFSLHYLELKERGMLDTFFDNIKMIKSKGVSFHVSLVHCDEYVPYTAEIQKICKERIGAYPQIILPHGRDEKRDYYLRTDLPLEKYYEIGESYQSDLFYIFHEMYRGHLSKFCYAGDWSLCLNLGDGNISRCFGMGPYVNIFDDISKEIPIRAIGHNCKDNFCHCSIFFGLGVIPGLCDEYTMERVWNRKEAGWFTEEMESALSRKLYENNTPYIFEKCDRKGEKVIISGLGSDLWRTVKYYPRVLDNAVALTDNNAGIDYPTAGPVICPQDILNYQFDKVVIASSQYYDEIYDQCRNELGIDRNVIISLEEYVSEEIFGEKYTVADKC